LFGIPITRVHDVFEVERITRVPLAHRRNFGRAQFARPRRHRARYAQASRHAGAREAKKQMAIGIDHGSEAYGLLVDAMGEVLKLSSDAFDAVPINMQRAGRRSPPAFTVWKTVSWSCSTSIKFSIFGKDTLAA
jgi:purine-binding chemotaxis protein CheW